MVYLILAIGILIGLYSLYKFFISATPAQIKKAAKNALIVVFIGFLLFLAVSGRLPLALILSLIFIPFVFKWLHKKIKGKRSKNKKIEEDQD